MVAYAVWSYHLPPREYASTALLFFDRAAVAKLDPTGMRIDQKHPEGLARLILNDKIIEVLCRDFGLSSNVKGGEVAEFRSQLILSDESTSSLRIGRRGTDRKQTMAIANAMAVLLSSWIPTDLMRHNAEPAPKEPIPPPSVAVAAPKPTPIEPDANLREVNAGLEAALSRQKELRAAMAVVEQELATLGDQAHQLEGSIAQINAERQEASNARQPLITQLGTEKKNLESLRARYTDAYPDVEAAQERIAETEKRIAALPGVRPAPDAERSRLNSITAEMKRLAVERSHLFSQSLKAEKIETSLRRQENSIRAAKPEPIPSQPQAEHNKPTLVSPEVHSPPAQNSQKVDFAPEEQIRVYKVLESATSAQRINEPSHEFGWTMWIAGPVCGFLYLLWAGWWFRVVHDEETLERIVPGNVAYLGAIPGMDTWRHNL